MTTAARIKAPRQPSSLVRFVPILAWLPGYQRAWLRADLIAGLTIVALLIPEGMAYAQIAGVPPQAAFYAAPIGLLLYAVFGSSRQLVVAVSAAIAAMSYATVSEVATPNTAEFIALTAALALLTGLVSVLAGILKLGRVAQFFSESVMVGFVTGLALVIGIKQVPKMLGIEGASGNFWERLVHILTHIPESHLLTLAVGLVCLVLMLVLERYLEKLPAALAALIVGIGLSAAFGLEARGVEVVGAIPAGLVPPQWPAVSLQSWLQLLPGAVGLALVCFAEAIGPARSFAASHKYEINANQELIGLGAANMGAGLFQGFPIGSSLSKSAANDQAGAHSQASGIFAALLTAIVALFFTGFFYMLPEATLGAIVIVAVSHMVKVDRIRQLYRERRADFALAMVALLAVLTFETLQALLLAVIVSLFALVWHASQPKLAVLGRVPNRLEFSDVRRHPENQTVPGLLMVRPENGLFFANAVGIRDAIMQEMRASRDPVKVVMIDLGATTDLDVPSADMLAELHADLRSRRVRCVLARVIMPVHELLQRTGALDEIPPADIFADPPQAVLEYLMSRDDDATIQAMVHDGLLAVRDLVQTRESTAPAERQAALAALAARLDQEAKRVEVDGQRETVASP